MTVLLGESTARTSAGCRPRILRAWLRRRREQTQAAGALEAGEHEGVDSGPGWTSTPARRRVSAASPARPSVNSSGVSGGTRGSADRVVTVHPSQFRGEPRKRPTRHRRASLQRLRQGERDGHDRPF